MANPASDSRVVTRAPKHWVDELEVSRQQAIDGDVVDIDELIAELDAMIEQMARRGNAGGANDGPGLRPGDPRPRDLVSLSRDTRGKVRRLAAAYDRLDRPDALKRLRQTIVSARQSVTADPLGELDAPRPYPELARSGQRWRKIWHYWIVNQVSPPVIIGIFHDSEDIPGNHPGEI